MKKGKADYLVATAGILLLALGLYLAKSLAAPQGFMEALPYVCIGLGCGVFGHGMGNIISRKAMQADPHMQKQMEIDQKDERNIAIANRAKGKAFDFMTFVFGALMLTYALMGVDMVAVLLLVFAYLLVQGYGIYYRCRYDKEM